MDWKDTPGRLQALMVSGLVDGWTSRPEWLWKIIESDHVGSMSDPLRVFLEKKHFRLYDLTGIEVLAGHASREQLELGFELPQLGLLRAGPQARMARLLEICVEEAEAASSVQNALT